MRVVDENGMEMFPEIFIGTIEKISESIKKFRSTRATDRLVVALIADQTRMTKKEIQKVIDSLADLEKNYLKPKKEKK